MKVLKKDFLISSDSVACTMEEKDALRRVEHPFIVRLFAAFQSDTKVYLVMEYVKGTELEDLYHSRPDLTPDMNPFCQEVFGDPTGTPAEGEGDDHDGGLITEKGKDICRDLGKMIAFDFLLNNWDRLPCIW